MAASRPCLLSIMTKSNHNTPPFDADFNWKIGIFAPVGSFTFDFVWLRILYLDALSFILYRQHVDLVARVNIFKFAKHIYKIDHVMFPHNRSISHENSKSSDVICQHREPVKLVLECKYCVCFWERPTGWAIRHNVAYAWCQRGSRKSGRISSCCQSSRSKLWL